MMRFITARFVFGRSQGLAYAEGARWHIVYISVDIIHDCKLVAVSCPD